MRGNPNQAGGGLPSQYTLQNGILSLPAGTSLPEGTVFIPSVNNVNANVQTNVNNVQQVPGGPNPQNVQRALHLLNGQFHTNNVKIKISEKYRDIMSVQCYNQQLGYKSSCFGDNGTNISTMGRAFKVVAGIGRKNDMAGLPMI